ncbi:MAG: response regulator [Elusimicrobiota bacterium]|nr:response regulator [Elusimicrobiota bacterium]
MVEDNALTRGMIKTMLAKLGYEDIAEAENGSEAIDHFSEFKPDVVFLDLILPGKSGMGVLEDLRNVAPKTRVVVITAVDQAEIDRQLSDKGIHTILRKPFSFGDFKTLMASLA